MNYLLQILMNKETGYYIEIAILIIIGIVLVLSIVMLTIIKKLKDK